MSRHFIFRVLSHFALAVAACGSTRSATAQFQELAAKVPTSANAIVLLDAEKLLASPLAGKEGWKEKYDQAFASGVVAIPPDTRRMILAAQLDYEYMRPLWELAIADFTQEHAVADIARKTKGTLDPVSEMPAVVLSDNSYCVQLEATRLAVMSPANRQSVSRWLREAGSRKESALSPYLQGTLVASQQSEIVVAFDLQDAVPPEVIRAKLAASSTLATKKIDLDAAAKAMEGLRGLVLEVAVTDGRFGRLLIHFRDDASVLAPFAKPLVQEVLGGLGATIDDIENWKVTTDPERWTLNGPLSAEGFRRVMSLIDHPTAALIATQEDKSQAQEQPQPSSKEAYATQQYFQSIQTIRDDLREKAKDVKTFGQHALWLDNWARRIDRLPLLDVDPEMLAYGRYTTARMRDASAALKGIGINSAARSAQVYNQYSTTATASLGYYGGGYSYYTQYNNVSGERRAIGAQERASGATAARQISREMDDETVKIRQAMSTKYKVNF